MDLVVEDLQGNEVLRTSQVAYTDDPTQHENADHCFDCLMEEESWIEDSLSAALGFQIDSVNIPQQLKDDYSNGVPYYHGVLAIESNGQHTHNLRLDMASQQPAPTPQAPQAEEEDNYSIAELEEMDLTPLHGKTFLVAISSGSRDKSKFICETVWGPFDFYEMAEAVGAVYEQEQLHAKVFIPSREIGVGPQFLNENTVDFLEGRYMDIIADGLLDGGVLQTKQYTCTAGFIPEVVEEEEQTDEEV